ncbi:Putative LOC100197594, partial [Caligus rogercresseyi]
RRQHHAPHFVEAGLKINTVEYVHILEEVIFPWMDDKFGLDNVVLVQDSAPCHGSKTTQTLLARKVPNFVKAQNWP